jgi:glucose-6-phosphate-specific signal transduction histidine kinase
VLPLCAGKRFGRMVGAKLLVFGVLMVLIPIIALLVDYGYSGLLFGFEIGAICLFLGAHIFTPKKFHYLYHFLKMVGKKVVWIFGGIISLGDDF